MNASATIPPSLRADALNETMRAIETEIGGLVAQGAPVEQVSLLRRRWLGIYDEWAAIRFPERSAA